MNESSFSFDATAENFQQGVIDNSYNAPVLVDFWAEWCEPCKQLKPVLEKLATDLNGQFVLAKVNSETQQSLSQQFQIRSIPTVLIFKNGEVVEQFSGLQTEQTIKELIEKHTTTEADTLRNQALKTIQSGDSEAGKQLLLEAEKISPENVTVQIDLAHLEARQEKYTEAKKRINQLKPVDRENAQVISLLSKIELAEITQDAPDINALLITVENSPNDSLPRFQLAIQLINQQDYKAGLEHLLYILMRDKDFQDGAVKNTMLSTFSVLGDDNPLVGEYRRKMFNALH